MIGRDWLNQTVTFKKIFQYILICSTKGKDILSLPMTFRTQSQAITEFKTKMSQSLQLCWEQLCKEIIFFTYQRTCSQASKNCYVDMLLLKGQKKKKRKHQLKKKKTTSELITPNPKKLVGRDTLLIDLSSRTNSEQRN